MRSADGGAIRFLRALVRGEAATRDADGRYRAGNAWLDEGSLRALESTGLVSLTDGTCRPRPEARTWLRRQMLAPDDLAAQHRVERRTPAGMRLNLAESPLLRLAVATAGDAGPYLEPHQVEAGERVRRLADRAQLRPRVTMSYTAARTAGGKGIAHVADLSDMAVEARSELAKLHSVLPRECADVVLDVCGFEKGLQVVETERGWPRRSAKLVLRIGLERLAQHYGYSSSATGRETRRPQTWLGEGARPDRFAS